MTKRARTLQVAIALLGMGSACSSDPDRPPPRDGGNQTGGSGSGGSQTGGSTGSVAGQTGSGGRGGMTGTGGSPASTGGQGGGSGPAGGSGGMGSTMTGGSAGSGSGGRGGSGGQGGSAAGGQGGSARDGGVDRAPSPDAGRDAVASSCMSTFSFFVTSMQGLIDLSGNPKGFGGDFRFGTGNGLMGADKICQTLAERVGAGGKTWRAFLSATTGGPNNGPTHAIERIGNGPWFDCRGRMVASGRDGLLGNRPNGMAAVVNDLPDETGLGIKRLGDSHDILTGSDKMGRLHSGRETCADWTSTTAAGKPWIGHSWPRSATSGLHWISEHQTGGCGIGINLVQGGGPPPGDNSVGAGGGYGGFYCFALTSQ